MKFAAKKSCSTATTYPLYDAALNGFEPKVMNQAVKRNIGRFPFDFMFQLTNDEWKSLRSQIVTSNNNRGGRRYAP
jgi:hypothetical protein